MAGTKGTDKTASILPSFIAMLLLPAVLGSSQTIFNDGDVSWHIATGEWILDHRAIPHVDPFSFTWAGKPWVPIEWLAELFYASAYRLAGYAGVATLVTAALIALHAIIYSNAVRFVRPWLAIGALVLADAALIPMLIARPHALTWPLLAFWTWLMLRAREQDRAPPLVAALLMAVWANLHGGFVFGLAIAAAFGLEALIASADRMRAFRQWLLFGAACVGAVFINGNGIAGVFHPLRFTHLEMLPLIDEWKPSNPYKTPLFFASSAIAIALVAWKRPRLTLICWVLLATFVALALLQLRHQAMLAIVAVMLLPPGFAGREREAEVTDRSTGRVVAGCALLLLIARSLMPLEPPDNDANPWKLIAAVPTELRSEPVLNGYSMGGPLILSGIRPYIDGRGDMYGDELVVNYAHIIHGDRAAFEAAVQRWNIRWAMVPNSSRPFIGLLDRSPGWRRIANDKVGAIYVRN